MENRKIKVCLAGATGWVGQDLARAIFRSHDLHLSGAVSRTTAGQNLGKLLQEPEMDLTICGSVSEALDSASEVLVDFTAPESVKSHTLTAIESGVHVVVGTSGLGEADFQEIDQQARRQGVGVLAAGNFALTAVLLQRFAEMAAKYIPHWEIIDYASGSKPDAPSGTARELAARLAEIRPPVWQQPIEKTIGSRESRGATVDGSQIHSLRLPGYVLSAEIIFGLADERLSIRHDAGSSAEPYVAGTLLAIRNVGSFTGLRRGLDKIINF